MATVHPSEHLLRSAAMDSRRFIAALLAAAMAAIMVAVWCTSGAESNPSQDMICQEIEPGGEHTCRPM